MIKISDKQLDDLFYVQNFDEISKIVPEITENTSVSELDIYTFNAIKAAAWCSIDFCQYDPNTSVEFYNVKEYQMIKTVKDLWDYVEAESMEYHDNILDDEE